MLVQHLLDPDSAYPQQPVHLPVEIVPYQVSNSYSSSHKYFSDDSAFQYKTITVSPRVRTEVKHFRVMRGRGR